MGNIQQIIRKTINSFFSENWNFTDFLTEDDIRCRLFERLHFALKDFANVSIHSEVRWYGRSQNLKYRSDLVILDNRTLNTGHMKLPSKGYSFNSYYSIIEIKLRRPNNKDGNSKYEQMLNKDLNKLQTIENETVDVNGPHKSFFLITFDKKQHKKSLVTEIRNNNLNWVDWK